MRFLNKPEYLFRPQQIISRLQCGWRNQDRFVNVQLPWGLPIRVQPVEMIGRSICSYGVYDLVTTESIVRPLDVAEIAIDVGANIGYMSGVMAWRAGPRGAVMCFEPCTEVYRELAANLDRWSADRRLAPIVARQIALSSVEGVSDLHIPMSFDGNHGIASLEQVL
jgi:hypothetical protein